MPERAHQVAHPQIACLNWMESHLALTGAEQVLEPEPERVLELARSIVHLLRALALKTH